MAHNTLDYITIRGFKSIASIEKLALRPINVLIGANGSGKSNFIGVFDFLQTIGQGRLRDYAGLAGGAEKVLYFGSKTTKAISFGVRFGDGAEDDLMLFPTADDSLAVSTERLPVDFHNRMLAAHTWRIYHLRDTSSSSPMRKTARLDDNRSLRPDGSNLPAFLYYLREKHRSSYDLIVRTVRLAAPFFDGFELSPRLLNPDDIKLEWRHKGSDQYFDASSLSDGTLRFIALATLFLQPEETCPSLILVDEPELGLHPYAIELLAALVRQASVTSQVILSTQSSLLLDHFAPEDVLVADRVDGGTQLRRLDSTALAKWLEDYSLGQLWEKNEFGGRPGPG
jgi:predicted ATPase